MATDVVAAAPAGIGSPPNLATGVFTSDGNAASLVCGFNPRYVRIINETSGVVYTKMQGNSVNTTLVSGAGTAGATTDTTGLIVFPADAGLNEPGATVLLSAALCGTGQKIVWAVFG